MGKKSRRKEKKSGEGVPGHAMDLRVAVLQGRLDLVRRLARRCDVNASILVGPLMP
jgi:hypothetical protein